MIYRIAPALVALCLMLTLCTPAVAVDLSSNVDLDISGYYRVRYDNIFGTGWYFAEDSDWWSYMDQRLKLDPSLSVGDNISLHMQLDCLRNVLLGQNLVEREPIIDVMRDPDDSSVIDSFDLGEYELAQGGVMSSDTSYTTRSGDEVPSVLLSRAWGQVTTPLGQLRIGRQGSHYGLGIFSNDGNGLDSDNGDTYDRFMWLLKVGPALPALGYDRLAESDFKSGTNDVHQFFALFNWLDRPFTGGLYLAHRNQDSTNARIFIYDAWAKVMFSRMTIEAEGVLFNGSMTQIPHSVVSELEEQGLPVGEGGGKIELSAYIAALEAHWDDDFWGAGIYSGFSSPRDSDPLREWDADAAANLAEAKAIYDADPDDPDNKIDFISSVVANQAAFGKKVYTYPFDADYNVDMILWEEIFGQVQNGMYAKAGGYLQLADLRFSLFGLYSWINESGKGRDGSDASHELGFELNYETSYTLYDHFTASLLFGGFWPGQYFYDSYEDVENLFTIQSNFVFHF
ncbi:MAG: hypothetical protein P9M14_08500 [Candidatus Alcyoniella australis]|nr:hypothetical protein [Candidatus Alcyoniella australis]